MGVMASMLRPVAHGDVQAQALEGVVDLREPCILHFSDYAREAVVATVDDMVIFLHQDQSVDPQNSLISFSLAPNLRKRQVHDGILAVRGVRKVLFSKRSAVIEKDLTDLTAELLPEVLSTESPQAGAPKRQKHRQEHLNTTMANTIVICDVLNAIGSGMSLKFMDLYLIEDYGISPIELLALAVVQNLAVVWLTPMVKELMKKMRNSNFKGALAVSLVWGFSLIFLALICIPDQNFYVSIVSIVLMNSLSSCTKAYNRAKLINAVPHNRIAKYTVWDSLNKANQGGIAIFGGQIAHIYGYRGCFMITFLILLLRWTIWTVYLAYRGCKRRVVLAPSVERDVAISKVENLERTVDAPDQTDFMPEEVGSELLSTAYRFEDSGPLDLMVLPGIEETGGVSLDDDVGLRSRLVGGESHNQNMER